MRYGTTPIKSTISKYKDRLVSENEWIIVIKKTNMDSECKK